MIDPFGVVLSILQDDADILSIVGTSAKVSSEYGGAPCVVLVDLATSRRPYGPGSGRVGHQVWVGAARCYGTETRTGAIVARQLAGAVSDALHDHGPHRGTSNRVLIRSHAPELAGLTRDPDTRTPHYDVAITAYLTAAAVA